MSWVTMHPEVALQVALICMVLFWGAVITILASGKTHEAEELEGFPGKDKKW